MNRRKEIHYERLAEHFEPRHVETVLMLSAVLTVALSVGYGVLLAFVKFAPAINAILEVLK